MAYLEELDMREFMAREERIKWYMMLHHDYYMKKLLQAQNDEEINQAKEAIEKLRKLSRQLYGH